MTDQELHDLNVAAALEIAGTGSTVMAEAFDERGSRVVVKRRLTIGRIVDSLWMPACVFLAGAAVGFVVTDLLRAALS